MDNETTSKNPKEALNSVQRFGIRRFIDAALISSINPSQSHCSLGDACFNLSCFVEAIAAYEESLRIDPLNGKAHIGLGMSHYYRREFDKAVQHIERGLSLFHADPMAHYILGLSYGALAQYQAAIGPFITCARGNPNNSRLHYQLGLAYLNVGLRDQVLDEHRILTTLDQNLAQRLCGLIAACQTKEITQPEAVTAYMPPLHELRMCFMPAHLQGGVDSYDEFHGLSWFLEAVFNADTEAKKCCYAGMGCLRIECWNVGFKVLEDSIELAPDDVEALSLLAEEYDIQEERTKYAKILKNLKKLCPNRTVYHDNSSHLY